MVAEIEPSDAERLWGSREVRAFLGHKAEFRVEAAEIKAGLLQYGIAAFLAHEDIAPTREWQEEILLALDTMDLMIPLLTPGFQESEWTGQEIGYALARGVPLVPVRLGSDPYGFIGRYQAMSGTAEPYRDLGRRIFELMLDNDSFTLRELAKDAFVHAVSDAPNFATANQLATYLPIIKDLSPEHITSLVLAYNSNSQVSGAHRFARALPPRLSELTGHQYMMVQEPDRKPRLQGPVSESDDLPS